MRQIASEMAHLLHITLTLIAFSVAAAYLYLSWPDLNQCRAGDYQACAAITVVENPRLQFPLHERTHFTLRWTDGDHLTAVDGGWEFANEHAWPVIQNRLTVAGIIFAALAFGAYLIPHFLRRRVGDTKTKHERGSQIVSAKTLARMTKKREPAGLSIAGVPIPQKLEPLSFRFVGAPGSGKSQSINRLVTQFRERGDPAVVCDPAGELLMRAGRSGDQLLNPFDARTKNWSPFAEIRHAGDAERFTKSLIPDLEGPNAQWNTFAQQVLQATLTGLIETDRATNGWLVYYCCQAAKEEWAELVAGSSAARWFEPTNERPFGSIVGTISTYLQPISYLDPTAGRNAFSVTEWYQQALSNGQVLWVTYQEDTRKSLRPLLSCWLDLAVTAALSSGAKLDRRFWLVVDELAAIGKIDSLSIAAAQGRKFGLSIIAGYQSVAQIRQIYGADGYKELLTCLQNLTVFRTGEGESAEACAKDLGDQELVRRERSRSGRVGDLDSLSEREAHHTQKAVLPSEIAQLDDLNGYLRLPGNYPVAKVQVRRLHLNPIVAPFLRKADVVSKISRPAPVVDAANPASDAVDIDKIPDPPVDDLNEELEDELAQIDPETGEITEAAEDEETAEDKGAAR